MNFPKTIVLIGFKSVGKTALGVSLAQKYGLSFVDLDAKIQNAYQNLHGKNNSCGHIARTHGIQFFRDLESKILIEVMKHPPRVLSVGGGTPLSPYNAQLLSMGTVIWVKTRKGLVFERIMVSGRPAFFPENEEAYDAFTAIWDEREPVYQNLADITIDNNAGLDQSVEAIHSALKQEVMA